MIQTLKSYLRDLPLQRKLTLTYLFAFFLPLIFITFFTINRIVYISNDKAQTVRQTQCDQITANIDTQLDEYYKSVYNFSTDQIINKYFDYEYEFPSRFFSIYSDISNQFLSFRISHPQAASFTIYTDNPTFITNGDTIQKLTPNVLEDYMDSKAKYADTPTIVSGLFSEDDKSYFSLSRMLSLYSNSNYQTMLSVTFSESDIFSLYQHEADKFNDFNVFLVSPTQEIFSSTQREMLGISTGDSDSTAISIGRSIPRNTLTHMDNKLYYSSGFDKSPMLKDWNLYIEISNETFVAEVYALIGQTLLLTTGIALLGIILFILCSLSITRRLNGLVVTMSGIKTDDDLNIGIDCRGNDEIGILSKNFQKMLQRIKKLIFDVYTSNLQVKDLEIKHKQAELLALQSQINPHFLFNTMQSLSISSYNNDDYETAAYINKFCNFLRESLYWETKCVPLSQEVQITENYLSLQKLRYEDKFDYSIDIPPSYYHIPIPKFTLQPIAENSIEHGLEGISHHGFIHIWAKESEDMLLITIEDNGFGIDASSLNRLNTALMSSELSNDSSNIGILNTNDRLRLFYGPRFGLSLESNGGGTKVGILISKTGGTINV